MKLLLDTHLLLWAASWPDRLPPRTRELIEAPDNELFFSAASLWEVAIKSQVERADFQVEPSLLRRGLLDNGYAEIPVTSQHAAALPGLPPIHKDPFDRMLIVQAALEGLTLLTIDAKVAEYPGPIKRL
jgi:PIN domain nuclease of toxin-antitoxin system